MIFFFGIKKIRDKFNLTDDVLFVKKRTFKIFVKGTVKNSRIRLCVGRNCKILSITAPTTISETARSALQKFSEKPFKAKVQFDSQSQSVTFTFGEYLWPYSWKKIGEVIENASKIIYDENLELPPPEETVDAQDMEKAVNMVPLFPTVLLMVVFVVLGQLLLPNYLLSARYASALARSVNADCPMEWDEWTSLDSASSSMFKIYLNYTVYGMDLESQDAENIKEMFVQNLRESGVAAEIADRTVWFIWFILNYFDSDGNEIFQIRIVPADYK